MPAFMSTLPTIHQPNYAHASTNPELNINSFSSSASSSSYDYDRTPNLASAPCSSNPNITCSRVRSPDISPFLSPSISSLTIAGSSEYVATYLSMLGVCIMMVILAECSTLLVPIENDIANVSFIYPGYAWLLLNGPELLERIFCYGALSISVLALSRRFLSQRQQDSAGRGGAAGPAANGSRFKLVLHAMCYPTSLIQACLTTGLLFFLAYFLMIAGLYHSALGTCYLPIAIAPCLLIPALIVHVWYSCTEAHCLSTTAITATPGRAAPALSLPRLWRGFVSILLLMLTFSLSLDKYLVAGCGSLSDSTTSQFALIYLACILLCTIAALVLLIADRHLIRNRQLEFSLPYFALLLAFQLRLPHYLYESWIKYFMPFYNQCQISILHKSFALVGYHLLLNSLQLLVRILSLLCVVPQHGLAMVYYIQWFEDFMADLTFFSVVPFSLLFFINALITMIKSLIRDCNGIRLLVHACIRYHRSTQQNPKNYGNNDSSVLAVLYQEYVRSFDLILTRHQTFIGESCSKCLIISVIVCQMVSSNVGGQGWHIEDNNQGKLISLAAFGFLWFLQLITHMIVLQLLRVQQKSAAAVYRSASLVTPTQPSASHSITTAGTTSTVDCSCPSCGLSYERYTQALQQQEHRDVHAATGASQYCVVNPTISSPTSWCCPLSTPAAPLSGSASALLPDIMVHPCIYYWSIHRWFFAVQMMHWVWLVLVDEGLDYGPCISQ